MKNERYDVIVVGGGPTGLSAGIELARHGAGVLLIDQKKEVGLPVQCGEAVSQLFMDEFGFSSNLPWIVSPVSRLAMIMPNGTRFALPGTGYCIRRDSFDGWLLSKYIGMGGAAHLSEKVLCAEEEQDGVTIKTSKGVYKANYVVAADGPLSRLAIWLGMRGRADTLSAIQYKFSLRGSYEPGILRFYFSGEIAGGYYWIFPRGTEISVGVGGSDFSKLRSALDAFCRRHGFEPSKKLSSHGGLIPCTRPGQALSSERVVVCGDAAGLVHPASKGGIHLAVHSGRAGGRAIMRRIGAGTPLSSYSEEIRAIAAFRQPFFDRLRSALYLNDRQYNTIGTAGAGSTAGRFQISRIFSCPAVWPLLPRLLGIYMAYRKTARWLW